jgi:hypothetical protein
MQLVCTNGPSLPTGTPAPSAITSPATFVPSVRAESRAGPRSNPSITARISGMPEPAAAGETRRVTHTAPSSSDSRKLRNRPKRHSEPALSSPAPSSPVAPTPARRTQPRPASCSPSTTSSITHARTPAATPSSTRSSHSRIPRVGVARRASQRTQIQRLRSPAAAAAAAASLPLPLPPSRRRARWRRASLSPLSPPGSDAVATP